MTRNHALILTLVLDAAVTAPAWAQVQKDWQASGLDKLADDPFCKSVRHGKASDAAFAPYTPGFSAEQHKYGRWQPIVQAREKGALPPQ